MYAASEWQREHVVATLTGLTVERDRWAVGYRGRYGSRCRRQLWCLRGQALAMHAGVILVQLVGAKAGSYCFM